MPPRPIGPTVPRWRLGGLLAQLREESGVSLKETARELDCSTHKLRKIFGGQVSVAKHELRAMLDMYRVADDDLRHQLEELAGSTRQRGWWSAYNRYLRPNYTAFIGFEYAATSMRNWQPIVMPGLLQTAGYTRALGTPEEDLAPDELERYVDVRMLRQRHVWTDEPPDAVFVMDESVLHRNIGGREVMREQLQVLLDPPDGCTVQIVPLSREEHPGTAGALTIFEFPADLYRPVTWLEGYRGFLRMEEDEVDGYKVVFDHVWAGALPVADSRQMIRGVLDELSRPSGGNT